MNNIAAWARWKELRGRIVTPESAEYEKQRKASVKGGGEGGEQKRARRRFSPFFSLHSGQTTSHPHVPLHALLPSRRPLSPPFSLPLCATSPPLPSRAFSRFLQVYNLDCDAHPQVIVVAKGVSDVLLTLAFAREFEGRLELAVRNGEGEAGTRVRCQATGTNFSARCLFASFMHAVVSCRRSLVCRCRHVRGRPGALAGRHALGAHRPAQEDGAGGGRCVGVVPVARDSHACTRTEIPVCTCSPFLLPSFVFLSLSLSALSLPLVIVVLVDLVVCICRRSVARRRSGGGGACRVKNHSCRLSFPMPTLALSIPLPLSHALSLSPPRSRSHIVTLLRPLVGFLCRRLTLSPREAR